MSADPHRQWRELIGAYVLGTLSAQERSALDEHLEGCAGCRAEATELTRVAALLPAALVDRIEDHPAPPVDLEERVLSQVRQAQVAKRRRGRWRLAAGVGVAAALVSVFALVFLQPGEPPLPPTGPEQVAFQVLPPGAEATAELTSLPAATELRIRVSGLPGGEYVVSMESKDGTAVEGKAFLAPSGSWSGVREVALSRTDAVAVRLSQVGGETEFTAALPEL